MNVNTCPVMPEKLTAEEVIDLSRHRAIALIETVENPDGDAHEAYLVEAHFYEDRDTGGRPSPLRETTQGVRRGRLVVSVGC